MTVAIMAATTPLLAGLGGCLTSLDDGFFCCRAGVASCAGFSCTAGTGSTGSLDVRLTGSDGCPARTCTGSSVCWLFSLLGIVTFSKKEPIIVYGHYRLQATTGEYSISSL